MKCLQGWMVVTVCMAAAANAQAAIDPGQDPFTTDELQVNFVTGTDPD